MPPGIWKFFHGKRDNRPLVVIGITRFSVDPSSIVKKRKIADLDAARLTVYDFHRLRERLRLFSNFALPSLVQAAKAHRDFYHIVAFSKDLPLELRGDLTRVASENAAWMRLLEVAPTSSFVEMVRGAVHALGNGRRTVSFRLDDDDAICPDFVDRLQEYCLNSPDGAVLSFDLGYYLQRISQSSYVLEAKDYPKVAIGLSVFRENGLGGCVFDLPVHTKIPNNKVINIRDKAMWIRTIHDRNDSGRRVDDQKTPKSSDVVHQSLRERFHFLPLKEALAGLPVTQDLSPLAPKILFRIQ